ncbi:hypothetical protein GCM10010365_75590 [Streptomyces poonensis]|uniref:Uncharacterized protein n=1 Tax=Streptomyces poonensis TaxID=68255 RepID=A0A918QEB1_9ACTN|nr:hypothetical protein GCM10010365_75590 [Streptomyces poonensis]
MTAEDSTTRDLTAAVRVRAEGDADEESLTYLREKVGAVLGRPGLPPVSGEVHVTRAVAHHIEPPWTAGADVRVGGDHVVVHARELADRGGGASAGRGARRPPGETPASGRGAQGRPRPDAREHRSWRATPLAVAGTRA